MENLIVLIIALVLLYVFGPYTIHVKKKKIRKQRAKLMKPYQSQVINQTDRKELITIESWN